MYFKPKFPATWVLACPFWIAPAMGWEDPAERKMNEIPTLGQGLHVL